MKDKELEKERIRKELEEIVTWSSMSKYRGTRLYEVYGIISNSDQKLCGKCPSVIRGIFNKVKKYYETNYDKKENN